jgi:UDP-N-acetylglucosamine:LPS N-acetylglucosamine transferase
MRKVMAVCSGGGHWVEMRRIIPAFEGCEVVYVCTEPELDEDLAGAGFYSVRNVTRRNGLAFAVTIRQIYTALRRERPDVVITTGAAPGLVGLALGKLLFGSRTIWIDSIAAGERLSLSGKLARPVADVRLTQWQHLARPGGPQYWGAVL